MHDGIRRARLAFEIAGRGCIVARPEAEPRYTTVNELAGRRGEIPEAKMLLTAISEAVETYCPNEEAVLVLETENAINVIVIGPVTSRRSWAVWTFPVLTVPPVVGRGAPNVGFPSGRERC